MPCLTQVGIEHGLQGDMSVSQNIFDGPKQVVVAKLNINLLRDVIVRYSRAQI